MSKLNKCVDDELFKDNDFYESLEEFKEKGEDNECIFCIKDIKKVKESLRKVIEDVIDKIKYDTGLAEYGKKDFVVNVEKLKSRLLGKDEHK